MKTEWHKKPRKHRFEGLFNKKGPLKEQNELCEKINCYCDNPSIHGWESVKNIIMRLEPDVTLESAVLRSWPKHVLKYPETKRCPDEVTIRRAIKWVQKNLDVQDVNLPSYHRTD